MKISLTNFKSYGDFSLTLPDTGLILLKGETGKGKTTVLEAIYDAITGDADDVAPWTGEKPITVVLELNDSFAIKRTHNPETLIVTVDGVEFLDAAGQAKIYEYLGMSQQEFLASCYIRQKLEGSLLALGAADQLRFIQRLAFGDQDPEVFKKRISAQIERRVTQKKTTEAVFKERQTRLIGLQERVNSLELPVRPIPPFTDEELARIADCFKGLEHDLNEAMGQTKEIDKKTTNPVHKARRELESRQAAVAAQQSEIGGRQTELSCRIANLGEAWSETPETEVHNRLVKCREKESFFAWKKEVEELTNKVKARFPDFPGTQAAAFLETQIVSCVKEYGDFSNQISVLSRQKHDIYQSQKHQNCPECGIPLTIESGKIVAAEGVDTDAKAGELADIDTKIVELEASKKVAESNRDDARLLLNTAQRLKTRAMKDPLPECKTPEELGQEMGRLSLYKDTQSKREYAVKQAQTDYDRNEATLNALVKSLVDMEDAIDAAKDFPTEDELAEWRRAAFEEIQKINKELDNLRLKKECQTKHSALLADYNSQMRAVDTTNKERDAAQVAVTEQEGVVEKTTKAWAASLRLKEISDAAALGATESIIDAINEQARQYIDKTFPHGGTSIRLLNGMTTKSGEERSKMSMEIIHRGIAVGRKLKPLSGGEHDRAILAFQMAMADIYKAPFMILDEPFTSVDVTNTLGICLELLKLRSIDRLIIMTQHGVPEGEFDQVVEI